MNWKLIVLGGLAFFVGGWIIGFVTGPLVHEGVLASTYAEYSAFWRPELNERPPDTAALMPRWILGGLIISFVLAGIYGLLRPAFSGAGWVRGLKYGIVLFAILLTGMISWSGIFGLPDWLWGAWAVETLAANALGGIFLGFVADKVAPESSGGSARTAAA